MREENPDSKPKKNKYSLDLINLGLFSLLFWSTFNSDVRGIVLWFYLVMMSAMIIFAFVAFKQIKIKGLHIFNISLQIIILGIIIYAIQTPAQASKVVVLLIGLQVFQAGQGFYVRHVKTERRTSERDGATVRK